ALVRGLLLALSRKQPGAYNEKAGRVRRECILERRGTPMRVLVVVGACVACGHPAANGPDASDVDAAAPLTVALSLDRRDAPGPDLILVQIDVHRGVAPVVGLPIELTGTSAEVGPITDRGDGTFVAEVTPTITSGNVALKARVLDVEVDRIAVVLPSIDP